MVSASEHLPSDKVACTFALMPYLVLLLLFALIATLATCMLVV